MSDEITTELLTVEDLKSIFHKPKVQDLLKKAGLSFKDAQFCVFREYEFWRDLMSALAFNAVVICLAIPGLGEKAIKTVLLSNRDGIEEVLRRAGYHCKESLQHQEDHYLKEDALLESLVEMTAIAQQGCSFERKEEKEALERALKLLQPKPTTQL